MILKNLFIRILFRFLPNRSWKKLIYNQKYRELNQSELGKRLSANAALKDIHKNKRCFVLGNGPSLKELDLSLLKDEITFTVNDLFYKEDFEKLNTNYHILADPHYFTELKEILQKLHEKSKPEGIFIESTGFSIMKEQKLDEKYPLHVYANGIEIEDLSFMDTDLCRMLPYFCTVVQSAIVIAAYMGFKEIYLLGCDCTGIMNYMDRLKENKPTHYAFELPEEECKKQQLISISSEQIFYEWFHIFKSYRLLREFLGHKHIDLINLTANSILDSLEKGNICDVIKR